MNKDIKIESRYVIKGGGGDTHTYKTLDEAIQEVIKCNYDEIDDAIMSRDDVKRDDNHEGYDRDAYDRAWAAVKKDMAESVDFGGAWDDGRGRRWQIHEIYKVVVQQLNDGMTLEHDIEIDEDDYLYGKTVMTNAGAYIAIQYLNNGHGIISVYEAISTADGHHDVIVSDNGSIWVLGDEDDRKRNADMFSTLGRLNVDREAIIDSDLRAWIDDRLADYDRFLSHPIKLTYTRYPASITWSADRYDGSEYLETVDSGRIKIDGIGMPFSDCDITDDEIDENVREDLDNANIDPTWEGYDELFRELRSIYQWTVDHKEVCHG